MIKLLLSGIVGAAIALLSAWLASRYKLRNEFFKLIGRQQALVHRWKKEATWEKSLIEKYTDWLKSEKPTDETLAVVIGYIEEGNKQIEPLVEEIETQRTTLVELERKVSSAHEEQERLKAKITELRSGSKTG